MIDSQIIARHCARQIIKKRFEVSWRDGSSVQLHAVWSHGGPLTTERALALPGGRFLLFDLARLSTQLAEDLQSCPERDRAGIAFFSLRGLYATADAMRSAVLGIGTEVATAPVEALA